MRVTLPLLRIPPARAPILRYGVAVFSTALALIPSAAHFFELFNKVGLSEGQYFVVQGIYRGWALFGYVWLAAMIVDFALAVALWRRGERAWHAVIAGVLIAISFAIFFARIYPANQATANWTTIPAGWQLLRTQWEFGHAVDAVLAFIALGLVTLAAIGSRD